MGFMNMLGGLVNAFEGGQQPSAEHVENSFDQITSMLPAGGLSQVLSAAFNSSETPAFGQLAGQLFNNSSPDQKAGLLNTLLQAAGPMLAGGAAGGLLSQLAGGGQRPLTPDEAAQVSPDVVHQRAPHAHKHDGSIVDTISSFYSEHPTLVKTLGGAILSVGLAKFASR